ncbi:DUF1284 domain-containing protein [Neorhizobium sp. JUb45]|uniref:DUF1284 domain-containing protein n=1 Tax=unclassified Neorhizobium TaxID=2629175 RepID=UPI00104D0033|nr:DUF1284 domain-containing protein [Neorhizobium sp. JUb45]TCR06489.1 hypothetical protein EDF70_101446 [Neorhizobium sp. JUb45]
MTVRLRPHHLLCLLTYVGKGYTPAFVDNYDRIARRLSEGEGIVVVDGPDDVCAALLCAPDAHCFRDSVRVRDAQAAADVGELLDMTVSAGARIDLHPALLARMRKAFAEGVTRKACLGCEWSALCSGVAACGYAEVRVRAVAEVCLGI